MQQLPTKAEREAFVVSALGTWNANPSYWIGDTVKRVSLWLPEGIVDVSKNYSDTDSDELLSVSTELAIFKELGNPDTGSRNIDICQEFQYGSLSYKGMPKLWDWGVNDETDVEDPSGQIFDDLFDLRSEQPPSHLPIQPNTLTEDVGMAEAHAHTTDLISELSSGELRGLAGVDAVTGKYTACSQRTLVAITHLLRDLLPSTSP